MSTLRLHYTSATVELHSPGVQGYWYVVELALVKKRFRKTAYLIDMCAKGSRLQMRAWVIISHGEEVTNRGLDGKSLVAP